MNPTTPRRLAGLTLAAAAVLATAACGSSSSTAKSLPTGALSSARSQASAALSSVAAAASSAASSAGVDLPSLPAGGNSTEFQACTLTIGLATTYASGADATAQLNAAVAARDKLADGTLRTQVSAVINAVRDKDIATVATTGKALADSCRSVILGATTN